MKNSCYLNARKKIFLKQGTSLSDSQKDALIWAQHHKIITFPLLLYSESLLNKSISSHSYDSIYLLEFWIFIYPKVNSTSIWRIFYNLPKHSRRRDAQCNCSPTIFLQNFREINLAVLIWRIFLYALLWRQFHELIWECLWFDEPDSWWSTKLKSKLTWSSQACKYQFDLMRNILKAELHEFSLLLIKY